MTGYTRKDTTNNIADGNIINADDLDNEFDGVQAAFHASTGHTHDGTAAEGAAITKVGPVQDVLISTAAIYPKTTNTVDLGTSSLKYKDAFIAGNETVGGTLAVTGVATLTAQPVLSSLTASSAVATDASKGLVSVTNTGTGNNVLATSPTLVTPVLGAATGTSLVLTAATSTDALRITQTGTGNAFVVEDSTSPDTTPFIVNSTGKVLIARDTASAIADGAMQINVQSASLPAMLTNTGSTSYRPHWSLAVADTEVASFGTTNTLLNTYVGGASRMTISSLGSTVLYPVTGAGSGLTVSGTNLSGATTNISVFSNTTFGSAATTRGEGFQTTLGTEAATFTLGELGHFKATQGTLGLNSVVTSQYGFYANSTLIGATNNYGFYSEIASATGRFNFYAAGTATNYFSGSVGIGSNAPSSKVQITVNESTAYDGAATDGQLAAGSTLFIQQTAGTNTGVAQIVFQPRTTFPYNRIVSSGGSAPFMTFVTNNSERLRIDSAGNLGLGVTPSAWNTSIKALQLVNGSQIAFSGAFGGLQTNAYFDAGGAYRYVLSSYATLYQQANGQHYWSTAPSGTAGNAVTFTQAMTLDASGNLGVGTTSPISYGRLTALTTTNLDGVSVVYSPGPDGVNGAALNFFASNNSGPIKQAYIQTVCIGGAVGAENSVIKFATIGSGSLAERVRMDHFGNFMVGSTTPYAVSGGGTTQGTFSLGQDGRTQIAISNQNAGSSASAALVLGAYGNDWIIGNGSTANNTNALTFTRSTSEKMRLDASGNLLVGTTTAIGSGSTIVNLGVARQVLTLKSDNDASYTQGIWNAATTGNNLFTYFGTETSLTVRGSISYNRAGGLVAYNTTSDYRAKDISGPVVDSGALIDSTPVYMGKMHGATQERPMFIAHETPVYAHTGEKDAVDADGNPVYQQMDASALIPVMWAEIQDLRKRLAAAGI